jgi:glycerophosphoryl diester phosphodiesterase
MAYGARLDWMLRPIAHRGLHDTSRGIIENSASAVEAAIAAGYAVEVDLRPARDGVPMVFHDATLDRLTAETGRLAQRDSAALRATRLSGSADGIMSLDDLLRRVAGRVPLLLEVKSDWSGDCSFERTIARALAAYSGHAAVMSFDPGSVAAFRRFAPSLPRGLIAEQFSDPAHWPQLSSLRRFGLRHLAGAVIARPHFIAYHIEALPALAPALARRLLGLPLLTWTVRSEADRAKAAATADAMIFETIRP